MTLFPTLAVPAATNPRGAGIVVHLPGQSYRLTGRQGGRWMGRRCSRAGQDERGAHEEPVPLGEVQAKDLAARMDALDGAR